MMVGLDAREVTTKESTPRIGIWMVLLILWMVVLRPLAAAGLWQEMHAATERDPTLLANSTFWVNTSFFCIVFLCLAALNIYSGLRLWRERTPSSIKTAIVVLWLTSPLAGLVLLIYKAFMAGNVTAYHAVLDLGSNLAAAAAWTLYLKCSRRVRRTYCEGAAVPVFGSAGAALTPR